MNAAAPPPRRVTRFDAYAAGLAAGEADRAAGLTEPRPDLWSAFPGRRLAYMRGYRVAFGDVDEDDALPRAPLVVDLVGATVEAFLGAWMVSGPSRWSWRALPAVAVYVAGHHLHMGARRHRRRRHPEEDVPPLLIAPGVIARNQGMALGWWLMRRRGELGEDAATRLGRNLLALTMSRRTYHDDLVAYEKRPR